MKNIVELGILELHENTAPALASKAPFDAELTVSGIYRKSSSTVYKIGRSLR
jgi:hypothetical protein